MSGCCPPSRSQGRDLPRDLPGRGHATDSLLVLPGGTFRMGTDDEDGFPADNEGPVREVTVACTAPELVAAVLTCGLDGWSSWGKIAGAGNNVRAGHAA